MSNTFQANRGVINSILEH